MMHASILSSARLLADGTSKLPMQANDPGTTTTTMLVGVTLAAFCLGLFAAVCWAVRRWRNRRDQRLDYQRWRLFKELCEIHGLGKAEIAQLRRLIKVLEIKNPAALFVQPDCFEIQRPTQFFSVETWRMLQQIRDRLFARRLEHHG